MGSERVMVLDRVKLVPYGCLGTRPSPDGRSLVQAGTDPAELESCVIVVEGAHNPRGGQTVKRSPLLQTPAGRPAPSVQP